MLRLMFEPAKVSDPCDCCSGRTTRLTRFIERDGDAYAVYYARFSDNHDPGTIDVALSIGKWWEGTTPDDRLAFALTLRRGPDNDEVMVRDAQDSPWQQVEMLGRMLDRQEALDHDLIGEVFHITDHIFQEDAEVRAYLGRVT